MTIPNHPSGGALRRPSGPQLLHVRRDGSCADMPAELLAPGVEVARGSSRLRIRSKVSQLLRPGPGPDA